MPTIQDYLDYKKRVGEDVLVSHFMQDVEDGTLVKCAVCGVYELQEHMSEARFDLYKEVCPDCERNGN